MNRYLYFFGRTPELSWEELRSVEPHAQKINEFVAEGDSDTSALQRIEGLGGTVKIARIYNKIEQIDTDILIPLFTDALLSKQIVFSIHVIGDSRVSVGNLLKDIKTKLTNLGFHARFVYAKDTIGVSSVVFTKQSVVELIIVKDHDTYIITKTEAVQDFEEWNRRDYGRPHADPKAGMLPPKVARMIVNISLVAKNDERITILDPFCGMGTILGEALLAGCNVIGSDQSEEAIEKARKNLEWLAGCNPASIQGATLPRFQFLRCDATHIAEHIGKETVDAIVTEPFMGETNITHNVTKITPEEMKNKIKGLEKLYIGCLREWQSLLKPLGRITIALPRYIIDGKIYFVKRVIDMCENYGYTKILGPIEYGRPQAVVRREFYIFQKKS